ncbi:hypothetical protein U9M48_035286 [Paspalum notatum var. saurae]|uniref:Uncharacterized protein n=1 Tax=Paspalum notatum var. saurae TaxID=547442 RepID=A0AAQ3X7J4_PASNO
MDLPWESQLTSKGIQGCRIHIYNMNSALGPTLVSDWHLTGPPRQKKYWVGRAEDHVVRRLIRHAATNIHGSRGQSRIVHSESNVHHCITSDLKKATQINMLFTASIRIGDKVLTHFPCFKQILVAILAEE